MGHTRNTSTVLVGKHMEPIKRQLVGRRLDLLNRSSGNGLLGCVLDSVGSG
jgi:hypothetical protein